MSSRVSFIFAVPPARESKSGASATKRDFALVPQRGREVVVLARAVEEEHADVLAFLTDGESWSSSALALALGTSQRTVQRALDSLAAEGKVQSFGQARFFGLSTPTASSLGSPGSMESSGMPRGKVMKVI